MSPRFEDACTILFVGKKAVDNKKTVFAPVKKDDDGVSLEERNRQLLDRVFEIQSIEDIVKNGGFKDDAVCFWGPVFYSLLMY